eukprot:4237992-Amphidinium_carterae.2
MSWWFQRVGMAYVAKKSQGIEAWLADQLVAQPTSVWTQLVSVKHANRNVENRVHKITKQFDHIVHSYAILTLDEHPTPHVTVPEE